MRLDVELQMRGLTVTGAPTLTDKWVSFAIATGWGVDLLHRRTVQWQFGLGAGGRRGVRRSVRAGDHRRSARQLAVPVTPAVYEQRGNGGSSRL